MFVYVLQRLQGHLPLNPMHFSTSHAPQNATPLTPDLAFNTAISFITNTNWQSYSPDTTVSYLVQMAALAVQNFVVCRGGNGRCHCLNSRICAPQRQDNRKLLADVTRCTVYVSFLFASGYGVLRFARCHSELQGTRERNHLGRREPGDRARPTGVAVVRENVGTNAAGTSTQTRLIRMKTPPLVQFDSDALAPVPGSGIDLHVRENGGGHASRMGAVCRYVGDVCRGRLCLLWGGAAGKSTLV